MHSDATDYAKSCDVYQMTRNLSPWDEIPLVTQITLMSFDKWALDFVGPINPSRK